MLVGTVETRLNMPPKEYSSQLMKAFRRRHLDAFRKILSVGADPDSRCPLQGKTLLCLACQENCREEYVRVLLQAGADPNLDNPAMIAARKENFSALAMLLQEPGLDVNIAYEDGGGILHFLCGTPCKVKNSEKVLQCIMHILRRPDIQINKPDLFGMTPIMYAAELYHEDRVQIMLQQTKHKVHLDVLQPSLGKSIREFIAKKFIDLKVLLPPIVIEDMHSDDPNIRLLAALQHRRLDIFKITLQQKDNEGNPIVNPDYWHDDPYYCTCLELACRTNGCEDFVKLLLNAGADPTSSSRTDGTPLIHFVLDCCNYETLKVLLEDGRIDISKATHMNVTALHVAAMQKCENSEDNERCRKCVELLLDVQRKNTVDGSFQPCIDINCKDSSGDTALHCAAQYGCEEVVWTLLKRGANIMIKNNKQQPPLHYIAASILEKYLDEQLDSNDSSSRTGSYTLIFKYGFLQSPDSSGSTSEMEPLLYMTAPHLRHLLQHPVVSSYLYLKWTRVRLFFYCNIVSYTVFVMALTGYILLNKTELQQSCRIFSENCTQQYNITENFETNLSNTVNESASGETAPDYKGNFQYLFENDRSHAMKAWIIVVLFFIGFLISELFQMFMLRLQYLRSPANYMNLLVTSMTGIIISNHWIEDSIYKHLCAISILISWIDLILISGRLPTYSIHLEMLKKVTLTFLTFMVWYFLLIIAFAFCFHALFYKFKVNREEEDETFIDPVLSTVKTIVMFAGEFSFSSLPFSTVPVTSHIVFVIFVFQISIVLLNLLNGLAVYDTQAIKENARVLSLVSLVGLVASIERTLLDVLTSPLSTGTRLVRYLPDPRLFTHENCSHRRQLHVFPNEKGKIKFYMDIDNTHRFKNFRMHQSIIKLATDIIVRRHQRSDMEQIKSMFLKINAKMEKIDHVQENCNMCIHKIIELISNSNTPIM